MITDKYSIETEHEVLETIMHFAEHTNVRVQKAMLKLHPECFYNPDNKAVFRMIKDCFVKQQPFHFVDILVLIPKDNNELYGRMDWLIDNYGKMHAGESNFDHYVDRLLQLMRLRKQIKLASQMINQVQECANPEEAQNILIEALHEISSINFRESKDGISNIEIAELFFDGKLKLDLVHPTSFEQLNAANGGGIMAKSFITIAAGAGVGKTGFAIFLLDAIARAQPDTQSLFFSLEMESKQIWMRHVGICGRKQFDKLSEDERMGAVTRVMQVPTQIYDASMCKSVADIDFILTTSRLRAMDKKISVIVVDYLGLVEAKGSFESNALKQTEITSKLAQLAIELDCIVIALSQINRSPSARATDDRCPYPSDASGSSGSYFSSTLWLGIDRPELYQDDPIYRNQFVIKCRKNRFGGVFDFILAFNDGTFAEVPQGSFRTSNPLVNNLDKGLFPSHRRDFNDN